MQIKYVWTIVWKLFCWRFAMWASRRVADGRFFSISLFRCAQISQDFSDPSEKELLQKKAGGCLNFGWNKLCCLCVDKLGCVCMKGCWSGQSEARDQGIESRPPWPSCSPASSLPQRTIQVISQCQPVRVLFVLFSCYCFCLHPSTTYQAQWEVSTHTTQQNNSHTHACIQIHTQHIRLASYCHLVRQIRPISVRLYILVCWL